MNRREFLASSAGLLVAATNLVTTKAVENYRPPFAIHLRFIDGKLNNYNPSDSEDCGPAVELFDGHLCMFNFDKGRLLSASCWSSDTIPLHAVALQGKINNVVWALSFDLPQEANVFNLTYDLIENADHAHKMLTIRWPYIGPRQSVSQIINEIMVRNNLPKFKYGV